MGRDGGGVIYQLMPHSETHFCSLYFKWYLLAVSV